MTADPRLVQRAALGDAEAFATIYEQSLGCVYAFALRRTSGREAAEKLTERILEQIFGQLDGYTGDVPFAAWLLGIAKGVASADGQEPWRTRARPSPCGASTFPPTRRRERIGVSVATRSVVGSEPAWPRSIGRTQPGFEVEGSPF